jgi:GT2 family glycosyltransferase/SAM-dependent methyltransferase/glycosyltransferase involved in cell wall biosynthesis
MEFTGERFVPGTPGQIKLEHLQRYALCREVVRGKRVLDLACGEGYGAAMLAATASRVIGIDIDPPSIDHARSTYGHLGNVDFFVGACDRMLLADGAVDVVVSFETIEHHARQAEMIREIRRVLAPGGLLVLSSPNQPVYARDAPGANPFHVRELTFDELEALLRAEFAHVRFWGQRLAAGCFTYALRQAPDERVPAIQALTIRGNDVDGASAELADPVYLLAACSDTPVDIKALDLDSVIADPTDDLYRQLATAVQHYADLHQQDRATADVMKRDLEEQAQRGEALGSEVASLRQERADLEVIVTTLRAELEERGRRVEALQGELMEIQGELDRWAGEAAGREAAIGSALTLARQEARRVAYEAALERSRLANAEAAWQRERQSLLRDAAGRTEAAQRELDELRRQQASLERELATFRGSRSWRLTAPLREARVWLRRGLRAGSSPAEGVIGMVSGPASTGATRQEREPGQPPARLPSCEEPLVSIIIPVHGQVAYTCRCLASIVAHWPATPAEVLVVDDASPDSTRAVLRGVENLRLVVNEVNQGFIRAVNRGVREARGRYLVFLNNDTEVRPGWCDELVRTFVDVPEAGIVGAKLLYPDGRLQEAGGLIWKNGSAWNVGRGDDPDRPEHCYRRDVDYVSGAALAVPRDLFQALGGFDEHYAPMYGEDSDLAFRAREAGRRVIYQPLARVIHHEGGTAGTDVSSGMKAHQAAGARKLYERWQHRLAREHCEPGTDVDRARERHAGLRVLVLDHCTPMPDHDAGSITTFNIMRLLQQLGAKVTFIPEDNYLFVERYTPDLQRMGIECLYAPHVASVEHHLKEKGHLYDLVLIFRFTAARRHLADVQRHCPRARIVLHTADLHFLREQRRADLADDPRLRDRATQMKLEELGIIRAVDATIVHSTYEAAMLAEECPGARVVVFGWTIDVPGTTMPHEAREHIAFVGGYGHPPNVDAAVHFALDVLPLVQARLPGVKFYVVGSRPPAEVRALAADDVIVTGFVKDLGATLDRVRLTVAPLRYGAGIKGKIATSLSHGVPCVASSLGVEGMELVDGREVLVADSPEAMAEAVVRLYTDAELWASLSANGLRFVRDRYSFDSGLRIVQALLALLDLEERGRVPAPWTVGSAAAGLEVAELAGAEDYQRQQDEHRRRRAAEDRLAPAAGEEPFTVPGFCVACRTVRPLRVDYRYATVGAGGERRPNWRQHLVCTCGLNARARAALHLLLERMRLTPAAAIYLMEQVTPLYAWLRTRFPRLVGSEYLGERVPRGASLDGIRNEDATRLTFADGSWDYVLSFDVFEHVPDYPAAFREAARCLRPGGTLVFTAPFDPASARTIVRARLRADGAVEHLLPPEYHGDPVDPGAGILCFQQFGWDVLEELRRAGFHRSTALLLWSDLFGYLGEQLFLVASTAGPREADRHA